MGKRSEYFEIQGKSDKKVKVRGANGKEKRARLTTTIQIERTPADRRGGKLSYDEAAAIDAQRASTLADLKQRSHGGASAKVYRVSPAFFGLREFTHKVAPEVVKQVVADAQKAGIEKVVARADERMHDALRYGQFDLIREGETKVPRRHMWLAKKLMGGSVSRTERVLEGGLFNKSQMKGLMRRLKAGALDMYDVEHGALQGALDWYGHLTNDKGWLGDGVRLIGSRIPVLNTLTNGAEIINDWTSPEVSLRARLSTTVAAGLAEFVPLWALFLDAPRVSNGIQSLQYQNDLRHFYGLDELFKSEDRTLARVRARQAKDFVKVMNADSQGILGRIFHPAEKAVVNGNGVGNPVSEVSRRTRNILNAATGKTRADAAKVEAATPDQLAHMAGRSLFEKPQTPLKWAQNVRDLAPQMKVNSSLSQVERDQWTQAESVALAQIAMFDRAKRIAGRR